MTTITQANIDSLNNSFTDVYLDGVLKTNSFTVSGGELLELKTYGERLFTQAPQLATGFGSFGPTFSNFSMNADNTVASITIPSGYSESGDNLIIAYTELNPLYDYVLLQIDIDYLNNNSSNLLINGVPATLYSPVNVGDSLTLSTDDGFKYLEAKLVTELSQFGPNYVNFTLSADGLTASITVPSEFTGSNGSIPIFSVVTEVVETKVTGTNHIYQVTPEQVKQINEERFRIFSEGGVETTSEVDYGQFILGYIELPTTIPDEYIVGASSVLLGDLSIDAGVTELNSDRIIIDMGTITVTPENNNSTDYNNVVIQLHLPYASPVNIDPSYVIGETISIEYVVDCYSGDANINISSTKTGGKVFLSSNSDLAIDVPYITTFRQNASGGNLNISKGGFNDIMKPYLEVVKNNPVNPDGVFTTPVIDENLLSDSSGFTVVEEVELDVKTSSNEIEMIMNQLRQGVFIK